MRGQRRSRYLHPGSPAAARHRPLQLASRAATVKSEPAVLQPDNSPPQSETVKHRVVPGLLGESQTPQKARRLHVRPRRRRARPQAAPRLQKPPLLGLRVPDQNGWPRSQTRPIWGGRTPRLRAGRDQRAPQTGLWMALAQGHFGARGGMVTVSGSDLSGAESAVSLRFGALTDAFSNGFGRGAVTSPAFTFGKIRAIGTLIRRSGL